MEKKDYFRILVEEIHSTVVATIDHNGHPVTRCIDMMLYDDDSVYFLTAAGKEFYSSAKRTPSIGSIGRYRMDG